MAEGTGDPPHASPAEAGACQSARGEAGRLSVQSEPEAERGGDLAGEISTGNAYITAKLSILTTIRRHRGSRSKTCQHES